MVAVIARRPVAAYFILTFAISWGGVLLVVGSRGMTTAAAPDDPRFVYAVLAMLAGPSFAAVLLTALLDGREGLRDLAARAQIFRVPLRWQAVALLAAPAIWSATLVALSSVSPAFRSGLVASPDASGRILVGLVLAAGAGLCEEIGWTGFAVPRLRRAHGVFATGVIVGVLWGAWHLLTNVFWAGRASAGDLPPGMFLTGSAIGALTGYLAAFRVLMVWVYDRTGSLLLAIFMHASLTASVLILDPAGITGAALLTYSFALAAAVWSVVAVVAAWNGWTLSHGRARHTQRPAAVR